MSEEPDSERSFCLFFSSGTLFSIAVNAYQLSKKNGQDGSHPTRPITAVIAAAASLEAFLNELIHLARISTSTAPQSVKNLTALGEDALAEHHSIQSKLNLVHVCFAGHPYDKGAMPFQDFDLLIKLRNAFVHLEPRTLVRYRINPNGKGLDRLKPIVEHPRVYKSLETRKLIRKWGGNVGDWIAYLASPEVEEWACETARSTVGAVLDMVPGDAKYGSTTHADIENNQFKMAFESLHRHMFQYGKE